MFFDRERYALIEVFFPMLTATYGVSSEFVTNIELLTDIQDYVVESDEKVPAKESEEFPGIVLDHSTTADTTNTHRKGCIADPFNDHIPYNIRNRTFPAATVWEEATVSSSTKHMFVITLPNTRGSSAGTERLRKFRHKWNSVWPGVEITAIRGFLTAKRGLGILMAFIKALDMASSDINLFLEDDGNSFNTPT